MPEPLVGAALAVGVVPELLVGAALAVGVVLGGVDRCSGSRGW
ncbi:hypothetical protein JOF29_003351 [Kribbella aluminosa]|uniref:Uncharacterized protein n=1 Tax=Kribbella aluminosa TaxID=416017 RepID=A0ABS4UKU1_9ACTN|nr:hypothetical protein [Kribbella aluminosa]MBP2352268.1 hypothetical protein [Kribbella aluminosa]